MPPHKTIMIIWIISLRQHPITRSRHMVSTVSTQSADDNTQHIVVHWCWCRNKASVSSPLVSVSIHNCPQLLSDKMMIWRMHQENISTVHSLHLQSRKILLKRFLLQVIYYAYYYTVFHITNKSNNPQTIHIMEVKPLQIYLILVYLC